MLCPFVIWPGRKPAVDGLFVNHSSPWLLRFLSRQSKLDTRLLSHARGSQWQRPVAMLPQPNTTTNTFNYTDIIESKSLGFLYSIRLDLDSSSIWVITRIRDSALIRRVQVFKIKQKPENSKGTYL